MRRRCLDKKSPDYARYGAAGKGICDRWMKFENFFADMGVRPPGTVLDRIDNNLGYSPSNCRWATHKESSRNRSHLKSFTIDGVTRMQYEWIALSRVKPGLIRVRLSRGWEFERAIK